MNDWFKERGIGQEQVAATLNVSVSTVSRIVNYKRDLSMRRAMILHTEYGIPFDVMYPSQLSEGEGGLSDKEMPGLDLEHRNRAYATHPMLNDSLVAKLLNRSHCLLDYGGCTNV